MYGSILAIIALIVEVVHFATTKDSSLPFIALVLVTLALLVPGVVAYGAARRV